MVNAEPPATGWDRHRGPDKKETAGRPRPGKRGAGSKEQRAWRFDFFFKAAPQYETQASSSYWQKTGVAARSHPTLCDPRDGSPPGSPVPGILQARTLEWVKSTDFGLRNTR